MEGLESLAMEGTDNYGDGLFKKDGDRRQHHCRKELKKMRGLAIKRRITHVGIMLRVGLKILNPGAQLFNQ